MDYLARVACSRPTSWPSLRPKVQYTHTARLICGGARRPGHESLMGIAVIQSYPQDVAGMSAELATKSWQLVCRFQDQYLSGPGCFGKSSGAHAGAGQDIAIIQRSKLCRFIRLK